MNRRREWRFFLCVALFGLLWNAVPGRATALPNLRLPTGQHVAWQMVEGRPLIVSFHGGQDQCAADLRLRGLALDYADRGVALVEVFPPRSPRRTCPGLVRVSQADDQKGRLARRYGVRSLPTVAFVTASGRVSSTLRPDTDPAQLLWALRRLLE